MTASIMERLIDLSMSSRVSTSRFPDGPEWRMAPDVWEQVRGYFVAQGMSVPQQPPSSTLLLGWRVEVRDDLPPDTLGVWQRLA